MATPGENAQPRAIVKPAERLEWQAELDSALADIDTRLQHPRRRASDQGPQPSLTQLGPVNITSELLDEIAWRVSEQLVRSQGGTPAPRQRPAKPGTPTNGTTQKAPAPQPQASRPMAPMLAPPPDRERMPYGAVVSIRVRWPLFRFRWRRKKRHQSLISFADSRVG